MILLVQCYGEITMVFTIRLLSPVAGPGYHDPILSHGGGDMGTVVIQGEHIRPDRPSCNLNKRDKITEQGDD